jgi:hypothetical protein
MCSSRRVSFHGAAPGSSSARVSSGAWGQPRPFFFLPVCPFCQTPTRSQITTKTPTTKLNNHTLHTCSHAPDSRKLWRLVRDSVSRGSLDPAALARIAPDALSPLTLRRIRGYTASAAFAEPPVVPPSLSALVLLRDWAATLEVCAFRALNAGGSAETERDGRWLLALGAAARRAASPSAALALPVPELFAQSRSPGGRTGGGSEDGSPTSQFDFSILDSISEMLLERERTAAAAAGTTEALDRSAEQFHEVSERQQRKAEQEEEAELGRGMEQLDQQGHREEQAFRRYEQQQRQQYEQQQRLQYEQPAHAPAVASGPAARLTALFARLAGPGAPGGKVDFDTVRAADRACL